MMRKVEASIVRLVGAGWPVVGQMVMILGIAKLH
jgi:hypothetical protein